MRNLLLVFLCLTFSKVLSQDYLIVSQSEDFKSAKINLNRLGFEHQFKVKNSLFDVFRRRDVKKRLTEYAILINYDNIHSGNELYVLSVLDEGSNWEYFFDKISNEMKLKYGEPKRFKNKELIDFNNDISFRKYPADGSQFSGKNQLFLVSMPNPKFSGYSHSKSKHYVEILISELLLFDSSNYQLGFKMLQKENYFEAIRYFSGSIDMVDNRMYSYIFRGWAKAMLEDNYGGMEDLNRAFDLMKTIEKREDAFVYYYKGLIHIKRGEDFEGCKCLSKAGELGKIEAYYEIQKFCK